MLYIVGGASRAGKSMLASRLCAEHGVGWFVLDVLRMGLYRGAPSLGFEPNHPDLEEADRLWPILGEMIDRWLDDGRDYLVDGSCLRPATVAGRVARDPPRIRACFLGYPDIDPAAKAAQIAQYAGGSGDWLSAHDPAYIRAHVATNVTVSGTIREDCRRLGLPFFDTGPDLPAGVDAAVRHLMARA